MHEKIQYLETDAFDLWQYDYKNQLIISGIDQAKALAIFYENYGRGRHLDLTLCPICAANKWLLKNGFIPARSMQR